MIVKVSNFLVQCTTDIHGTSSSWRGHGAHSCRGHGALRPVHPIQINSPLRDAITEWEASMQDHPDYGFTRYILAGIKKGFRIGFDHASPLRRAKRNMPSATEHPEVVGAYIQG